ncbi:transcription elongation GreA/GreB family factor/uncharacterized protein YjiS (DUF1127 family) [Devosia subaequoris]|uniref:Transcription elongation GreA/GreB family factor/uncharacterized protein YjiS (DUF1127 family) n=1 Tax=Devosia subaequoris TaxID=395930 RepID=A0A7W6ND28_9HYPH|nr:DUF1127 domain-containing protein [Devosia subaequoris]MBB4053578.1 transcription elongation GreA/GreB family factor/uncharacterized protein YjiS (DUF1127 family) [Devosia subaequoris]MCP1211312.1 DUF1127 domain-containing protein [Devosia subaequoris]
MQINHPTTLTADDHVMLARFMRALSESEKSLAAMARRKLETAVILHPQAAADDLVSSGRRVRYCVNGAIEAEHALTWDLPKTAAASAISLRRPLGLALLGLRTGQSVAFPTEAGIETVEVIGVSAAPGTSTDAAPRPVTEPAKLHRVAAAINRQLRSALARMQKARAETTLRQLSDGTLRDIGITRSEIPYVAGVVAGLIPAATTDELQSDGDAQNVPRPEAEGTQAARGGARRSADFEMCSKG